MTERPILFSAPMVRAILDGSKTQTRRVAKFAETDEPTPWPCPAPDVCEHCGASSGRVCQPPQPGEVHVHDSNGFNWHNARCPYGAPGDTLWVRETYALHNRHDRRRSERRMAADGLWLRSDDPGRWTPGRGRWRPSIHMPRWASRITLEVTSVRVQRVRQISDDDARAEGVTVPAASEGFAQPAMLRRGRAVHRAAFRALWDTINAARGYSWKSNPWVWVVEFRRGTP